MPRKVGIAAVAVTMLMATLLPAAPAWAVFTPGAPATVRDPATQLTLTDTGPGTSVNGFLADPDNPFDPVSEGYPTTDPAPGTGWTAQGESFAGVIIGTPPGETSTLELYCINIRTDTFIGVGYQLGTWDSANVQNIGYVARLLNTYYPETDEPAALTNLDQKAAAVQAAIWFFSDRYVLSTSDHLHNAVAAIVADVISKGALPEPSPPTLTITPSSLAGPVGSLLGPFTVTSSTVGEASVSAVGGTMYSDATGTTQIPDGSTVPSGTRIWVRSTGPPSVGILATATATVPSGNAYLYDQNSGLQDAQKLILAKEATLRTTVSATAQFQQPGSLTVTKTIAGPAASSQGQIVIQVVCDDVPLTEQFIIPARTGAGDHSLLFSPIDAGSVCQVNETQDGHTSTVTVKVTGNGSEATIPAAGNVDVHLTDTYDFVPGSLVLTKSIEGPAAGHQGAITINISCVLNGVTTDLAPWQIPADATGQLFHRYDNIPAGSVCTVTEPGDGSNPPTVSPAPGSPALPGPVTVTAARIAFANVTDTYNFNDGNLVISKTIAGGGAGQQDVIILTPTCVDPSGVSTTLAPFTIDANSPAGTYTSPQYTGIAANSVCTVTETASGGNAVVAASLGGDNQVVIPPGATATAEMTDTYDVGALAVTKTIDGDAAGAQEAITIAVNCTTPAGVTTTELTYTIPAGTTGNAPAPPLITGLIAGTTCTVTESPDGSSSTVTVAQSGTRTVTISANGTGTLNPIDTYSFVDGSLTVTKVVAGPSGGTQDAITIQTSCVANGITTDLADFTIPAATPAGSPLLTHTYPPVAATSVCTVTETADGSSSTVNVVTVGSPQNVTVPAGGTVTATITDTYTPADGSLLLSKTISGPSAGKQGAVTIDVTCGATTFPTFVISAGTKAGTFIRPIDGIAAGSTCTVTETNDGSTSTVVVTVTGANQSVAVPAGTVVPVEIDDIYSDGPGSLIVTKTLTGPAAGQQGAVSILADCGGPETFALDIPAGTAAGSFPQRFDTIPAGSTCTVQETVNGGTDAIIVDAVGSSQTVTVPAGGTASVAFIDSFAAIGTTSTSTGQLAFTGSAARQLGELGAALILVGVLVVVGARPRTRRWRRARKDR
jgi:uncharacterized protein DUF5979/fibronectin-binding protein